MHEQQYPVSIRPFDDVKLNLSHCVGDNVVDKLAVVLRKVLVPVLDVVRVDSDGCEMFRWSLGFMVGWGLIQQWVPDGRNNVLEDGRLSFHTGSGVSWNIDGGLWVVWNPI